MATTHKTQIIGNPIKIVSAKDIKNGRYSTLLVENADSYNAKSLIAMDITSTIIRLPVSDGLEEILNNGTFPNNYKVIIPENYLNIDKNNYPNLTEDGLGKIKEKFLPKLALINATHLTTIDSEKNFWRISWEFDGYYGIQTAEYKGLRLTRDCQVSTSGDQLIGNFSSWQFADDSNMIGTLRLDYINTAQHIQKNIMGWIPTDTPISKSKYPRLYKHIETYWTLGKSYTKGVGETITIKSEKGLYPRFIGNQNVGFDTNPDCPNHQPSDNVDYANIRQSWSGAFNLDNSAFIRGVRGICFYQGGNGRGDDDSGDWGSTGLGINFSYGNSSNETRPKSKFFSLLIYAGYPA